MTTPVPPPPNIQLAVVPPLPSLTTVTPITPDQLTTLQYWLPNDAETYGWDATYISTRWTGGIVSTIRAYWYDRVQDTASYLDLSDPSGNLPITQIHRQAMEMLQYWDAYLLKYGDVTNPDLMGTGIPRPTRIGKIARRYPVPTGYPVPLQPTSFGPYNYTDP